MNLEQFNPEMLFARVSGKLSAAINRQLYRSFRKSGVDITPEQWTVLYYLWSKDGVTQQELCNVTFKDKPSMTRLIDNLEKQSLVVRSPGVSDRRINIIHLTETGKNLENEAKPIVQDIMKKALDGLDEKDVEVGFVLLTRVFNNLKTALDD